ncbi:MAG: SDR family NAD(P)-dependent oxidoreductase [Rhodobacteraceae bacterium]|nr:SDR family NAD(P)-dependent oxidoreductase [Paracoccaceae bacterium]
MNLFYITGSSSGLGKALAELLLEDENNSVIGVARSQTIQHARYTHVKQDLTQPITDSFFQEFSGDCQKVVLINNAGAIGPITKVGTQSYHEVAENFAINLTAPSVLCNQFVAAYQQSKAEKIIINISSGAGKSPIEGWSTYCASKAALDMFSQVLQAEQPSFKVFAVAPGIVDTPMQEAIRLADENQFPHLDRFKAYKVEGILSSPREVALKYLSIIEQPQKFNEVLLSVRDF